MYGMFRIICTCLGKSKCFLKTFFFSRKSDKKLVILRCVWYDVDRTAEVGRSDGNGKLVC